MGLQEFDLAPQVVGLHQVVGRGPRPKLAPRQREAVAQGLGQLLVRLRKNPHLRMRRVAGQNLGRAVGRAVIDHDQLEILIGLGQHALDRLPQKVRVVINGQDHAHQSFDFNPG
jgi:hypothetical protein